MDLNAVFLRTVTYFFTKNSEIGFNGDLP